jgi:hypothetical protein
MLNTKNLIIQGNVKRGSVACSDMCLIIFAYVIKYACLTLLSAWLFVNKTINEQKHIWDEQELDIYTRCNYVLFSCDSFLYSPNIFYYIYNLFKRLSGPVSLCILHQYLLLNQQTILIKLIFKADGHEMHIPWKLIHIWIH